MDAFVGIRRGAQVESVNKSLRRLGKQHIRLNQQYLTTKQVVRVLGQSGLEYVEIGPEEIMGDFDVVPCTSILRSSQAMIRQDSLTLFQTLSASPFVNQIELVKDVLTAFEYDQDRIDRLIVPPPRPPTDPLLENTVLQQGVSIPPSPDEDFISHIAAPRQLLDELLAAPVLENERYAPGARCPRPWRGRGRRRPGPTGRA